MSFLDSLKALFGGSKPAAPAPAPTPVTNNTTVSRPKNRQVFAARQTEVPEWAQNLTTSELLDQLKAKNVCKYVPNFEVKKIMSAKTGPDGNLLVEYDGIAGDCGAIKNFGAKVAQQAGMTMPYKYFDLNNAYRACCDNPRKCPFFLHAENENETVNARRR